jgi:hypothetical protein
MVPNREESPNAPKKIRKKSTPVVLPRSVEVTVVAKFERPWKNDRDEILVLDRGKWHPTSVDFLTVANVPNQIHPKLTDVLQIETLGQLIGALKTDMNGRERPDHTVKRLNIISHGQPGLVALSGTVAADGRCMLGGGSDDHANDRRIDEFALNWLNNDERGRGFREIARQKLHKDAEIWLILGGEHLQCHGAGIFR